MAEGGAARRSAERWGRIAELAAMLRLACAGFRPVAWRFRHRSGEIDLVAARGGLLAFVEVKARPSADEGLAALTPRQWRRVEAASRAYLAQRPRLAGRRQRFDAVLVMPWRWPRHLPDAWRPDRP